MSLLQKIQSGQKIEPPKIEPEVIRPVQLEEPSLVADPATCQVCAGEVFWLPIGSNEHLCDFCCPAPAESLVKFRFFFFEGDRWVVSFDGDQEIWTKESCWEKGATVLEWPVTE